METRATKEATRERWKKRPSWRCGEGEQQEEKEEEKTRTWREGERGEGGGFEEAALRTRTTERPAEVK